MRTVTVNAAQQAKILKNRAGEALETRMYEVAHRIRKSPLTAVSTAFAIGALVSWASTRRRRR